MGVAQGATRTSENIRGRAYDIYCQSPCVGMQKRSNQRVACALQLWVSMQYPLSHGSSAHRSTTSSRLAAKPTIVGFRRGAWLRAKRTGSGRDPRINEAGDTREGERMLLSTAVASMTKADMPNWPYRGPSSVLEVLQSIRATGLEPPGYLSHYLQSSGLAPASGLANEVRILITHL